jgi:hypothetical protein
MRFLLVVAALLPFPSVSAIAADAARMVVAQLAPAPDGAAPRRMLAEAAPRLASLGLLPVRSLGEGLAVRGTALGAGAARVTVPGFAPGRIVLLEAPDSALAAHALRALAEDPFVEWAEPLAVRALQLESLAPAPRARGLRAAAFPGDSLPDDPMLRDSRQWGLWNLGPAGTYGGVAGADVDALAAWRVTTGREAVRLAVADTGIDPDQPELGGWLIGGGPRLVDAINVTREPVAVVTDSFGHGTPVAGVMSARTHDGPHFGGGGVAGVAGGDGVASAGCALVPIKIAPGRSGYATSFDIARAAIHAADAGARAMNLSFAGDSPSRLERMAVTYALLSGCVVVAAAGNRGASDPTRAQWPAAFAREGLVIQVGASDPWDARAVFSSYGPGLDLVAPGTQIMTTFMSYPSANGATYDGYVAAAGTSFAAPFVTGAVGLLASARPELRDTDFQQVLRRTADDIGDPGVDAATGHGRLNLARALHAVRPEVGIWHDEVVADSFVVEEAGVLEVGEDAPGTMGRFRGTHAATRIAAYATVTIPDSLTDSLSVWTRVGGTFAARGDFRMPYFTPSAHVAAFADRRFTLKGYLFRIEEDPCGGCDDAYVPLAPSNVRFGFTVVGRADRGGGVRPATVPTAAPAAALAASPNPFRGDLSLALPGAGEVEVLDAQGRRVRAWRAAAATTRWDGRDAQGRAVPVGLYLVRWRHGTATAVGRVVRW